MTVEERISSLEAHIRALEALLLQFPGLTEDSIEAAKKRLEADRKRGSKMGELLEKLQRGRPLDAEADGVLSTLLYKLKKQVSE